MTGLIILGVFLVICAAAIRHSLRQSPYGRSLVLPFGRCIPLKNKLPWTEPPQPGANPPKMSPALLAYLQGDLFTCRMIVVSLLHFASRGYLTLHRNPVNGIFEIRRTSAQQTPNRTALSAIEINQLRKLFPDDERALVINHNGTGRLKEFSKQIQHDYAEKFAARRRSIPNKFLMGGLLLSIIAQFGIAATSHYGLLSMAMPVLLILCPLAVIILGLGFYTSLRAFYYQPYQYIAERAMVFGIGTCSVILAWLVGLWVGLWAYGIIRLLCLLAVQALTASYLLLCRQPSPDSRKGHKSIASISDFLIASGKDHQNESGEDAPSVIDLDEQGLLLSLATGTERAFLCPEQKNTSTSEIHHMTATDRLIEEHGIKSEDDAAPVVKMDKHLLVLFQHIQRLVPVCASNRLIQLPEWLDISPKGVIEPDALVNVLGELLFMELVLNFVFLPSRTGD